jgi:hypothetical protein
MFPVEQSGGYVELRPPDITDVIEVKVPSQCPVSWLEVNGAEVASQQSTYTLSSYGSSSITFNTRDGYGPNPTNIVRFSIYYGSSTIPVSGVSLNQKNLTATLGDAPITLTATVQPSNATNQTIFWTSSNNNVATVSNGMVSFVSAGSAVIEVKTQDGNFTDECSVIVQAPQTIQYTINLSASPPNGGTVGGGGTFDEGTARTVVATPANGWEFVNWTENGNPVSTAASYSFTLDRDRSLAAQFQEIPPAKYQVSFSGNVQDAAITLGNRTQAAGQYVFEDVAPGQYTYSISKEGYQTLSGNVEVVDRQVAVPFTLVENPPEVKSKVPIFEGLPGEYQKGSAPVTLKIIGEGTEGLAFTYTIYTVNSKGERENPVSASTFASEREGEYLVEAISTTGGLSIWTIVKVIK